jgi:hypothetical protein
VPWVLTGIWAMAGDVLRRHESGEKTKTVLVLGFHRGRCTAQSEVLRVADPTQGKYGTQIETEPFRSFTVVFVHHVNIGDLQQTSFQCLDSVAKSGNTNDDNGVSGARTWISSCPRCPAITALRWAHRRSTVAADLHGLVLSRLASSPGPRLP